MVPALASASPATASAGAVSGGDVPDSWVGRASAEAASSCAARGAVGQGGRAGDLVGEAGGQVEAVADGEGAVEVVIVVQGKAQLLQVIHALRPPRGLPSRLYGGEQQGDEDRDDGDDNQKLDQC